LFEAWKVTRPSAPEAEIFRQALYDSTRIHSPDIPGRRSAMIFAVIEVLRNAHRGMSEGEMRASLVWQRLPNGPAVALSDGPDRITQRWKVLQIRQAQRLALECLLGWFEEKLHSGESRLTDIQAHLGSAL